MVDWRRCGCVKVKTREMKMKKMKNLLMMASTVLLAGAASAGYVLDFVGDAGSGVGSLTISTDASGGFREFFALVADNGTATMDVDGEAIHSPFDVVDTGFWHGVPATGYNGYVGAIGGDAAGYDFVPASDGLDYSTLTDMTVMSNIGVTFSEDTTFILASLGTNLAAPVFTPVASVAVPEPATFAFVGIFGAGLLAVRRWFRI
jgi:hypothetical protein